MPLIKTTAQAIIFVAFYLSALNTANAISLGVSCEVSNIASRSRIVVRAAELSGRFVVRVVSGKVIMKSKPKATDKGMVRFVFDSDPTVPGATPIPADYIKRSTVAVVIRKAGTNSRMGGIRAMCNVM